MTVGENNMVKCEKCLNSRPVVSENGLHPICCLSQKKAMDCMTGKKNYFSSEHKVGDIIQMDKTTKEWFKKNRGSCTTVTQCPKCKLWYKPDLGHDCLRDGLTTIKHKAFYE